MTPSIPCYTPARFPTPVVRSRRAGDFLLSETRYRPEAALPMHAHEYACVVVVLEGGFDERHGAKAREVGPGAVIVRPAGEPHSNRFGREGGRCLNVELPPWWLARMLDVTVGSMACRWGRYSLLGRRLHLELIHDDDLSALGVELLVLEILAGLVREERSFTAPRWLLRARDRIHDDPAARVTLSALAADAGVHPVHFATTFRRFFGRTVATTIRQVRIELACQKLSRSEAPIADVAFQAGFADQSHLGRALKRELRVTPAAYRVASRRGAAP